MRLRPDATQLACTGKRRGLERRDPSHTTSTARSADPRAARRMPVASNVLERRRCRLSCQSWRRLAGGLSDGYDDERDTSPLQTAAFMTENSDELRKLLDSVLAGDGEALASVFSIYRDRLRRMVELRMDVRLRGRVSPSDILQESYLGALQRLPHYQASSDVPIFVWLRSVTMQRLIDVHRRHVGGQARDARREIRLGDVEALEAGSGHIAELFANNTSPSLAARRGEIMALVRDALEQLDPIDREVLVLRHFEQMSNHEAAASLCIKPAAASKRYVRAVERLRSVLEQFPEFERGET